MCTIFSPFVLSAMPSFLEMLIPGIQTRLNSVFLTLTSLVMIRKTEHACNYKTKHAWGLSCPKKYFKFGELKVY